MEKEVNIKSWKPRFKVQLLYIISHKTSEVLFIFESSVLQSEMEIVIPTSLGCEPMRIN